MVFLDMLNGAIHQFGAYLCRLINRKNNFGFQDLIEYGDRYYGQDQQNHSQEFVFGKETQHFFR